MKDMIKVDRRDFFKFAASVGVSVPAWGWISEAQAQTMFTGKILCVVYLDGGESHTYSTDPRPAQVAVNAWAVNGITPASARGLRHAPVGAAGRASAQTFLDRFQDHMMFVNGCNNQTNDHGQGRRVAVSGQFGMFPTAAELYAYQFGRQLALPWLSATTMEVATSIGLVAPTPVPNAASVRELLLPNTGPNNGVLMKQADLDKMLAARTARMQAKLAEGTHVPRQRVLAQAFADSGTSRSTLATAAASLPAAFNNNFATAHAALSLAATGLTSVVQLQTGGYDNHDNIGPSATQNEQRKYDLLTFIWDTAAQLNIANRLFVMVASDFGRTNMNNGQGQDHQANGGHYILMEQNAPWAGRVIGHTTANSQGAGRINFQTGASDMVNGRVINPRHVHAAVRKYLNMTPTDPRANLQVPAAEELAALFNPAASTGYPFE